MSWELNSSADTVGNLEDELDQKLKDYFSKDGAPEGKDQAMAAVDAAMDIIRSQSVGDTHRKFTVVLRGHANPDHKPVEGYSQDYVMVEVRQVVTEGSLA